MRFVEKKNTVILVPSIVKLVFTMIVNIVFIPCFILAFIDDFYSGLPLFGGIVFYANFYYRKIIFFKDRIIVRTALPKLYYKEVNLEDIAHIEIIPRSGDTYVLQLRLINNKGINIGGTFATKYLIYEYILKRLRKLLKIRKVVFKYSP